MLGGLLLNRSNIGVDSNLHMFTSKVCTYVVLVQIWNFTVQLCSVFFIGSEIEEEVGRSEIQEKVEDLIKTLAEIHRDDDPRLETLCHLAYR